MCSKLLRSRRRFCVCLLDPEVASGEAARPSEIHPAEFLLFTFAILYLANFPIPSPFSLEQISWTPSIYKLNKFYCIIIAVAALKFTDFSFSSSHSLVNTDPPSPTRARKPTTQIINSLPPSHLFRTSSITIHQSVLNTDTCILVGPFVIRLPFQHILGQLLTSPSISKLALLQCKTCFSHIFAPLPTIIQRFAALQSCIDTKCPVEYPYLCESILPWWGITADRSRIQQHPVPAPAIL